MANTLFLRLEGPLQSWGERGRWSIRDTASEPTKSGVVGLLGCALGWADDQRLRSLSQAVQIGVRCDRPGVSLIDYHTVIGGVMAADGKIKINSNTKERETVVSWRAYLCDASFIVALQSSAEWIDRLSSALQAPVWPVYLGRKSCPPSLPVYDGIGDYETIAEALKDHRLYSVTPGPLSVRVVLECRPGEGQTRSDEVLSNSRRTFLPRHVQETVYQMTAIAKEV